MQSNAKNRYLLYVLCMMDLRAIRSFLAVAQHGSLSAAARVSYVTQPSLSRRIAELEREFGVSLFHRTASGLKLNQAGERFLPIATDIERRSRRGAMVMKTLTRSTVDLVLACPFTVLEIIADFIAETGAPITDVREVDPTTVYDQLERGADIALGTRPPPLSLARSPLVRVGVSVQASRSEVIRDHEPVDIAALAGHDLIVVHRGSSIRRMLDDVAISRGVELTYAYQVSSSTVAQALAAAGRGHAVVSAPRKFDLSAAPLWDGDQPVEFVDWLAWDPGHYAAPEIEMLQKSLAGWLAVKRPNLFSRPVEAL